MREDFQFLPERVVMNDLSGGNLNNFADVDANTLADSDIDMDAINLDASAPFHFGDDEVEYTTEALFSAELQSVTSQHMDVDDSHVLTIPGLSDIAAEAMLEVEAAENFVEASYDVADENVTPEDENEPESTNTGDEPDATNTDEEPDHTNTGEDSDPQNIQDRGAMDLDEEPRASSQPSAKPSASEAPVLPIEEQHDWVSSERELADGSILVTGNAPTPLQFEIVLSGLPEDAEEYVEIMPNYIENIFSTSTDEKGYRWFEVQYRDGRNKVIPLSEVLETANGEEYLAQYAKTHANIDISRQLQKYQAMHAENLRQSSITSYVRPIADGFRGSSNSLDAGRQNNKTSARGSVAPNHIDGSDDELAYDREITSSKRNPRRTIRATASIVNFMSSDDEDDGMFVVRSDIAPPTAPGSRGFKKGLRPRTQKGNTRQKLSLSQQSDIEFEPEPEDSYRRSTRTTKTTRSMKEIDAMDPESFYIEDNRVPVQPKTVGVKELFRELSDQLPFSQRHMQVCGSCNHGPEVGRGILVYCQGCSLSFHRMCLGNRFSREHWASKVGEDEFVLQCRFCIGRNKIKDELAPCMSMCQVCHEVGESCAPFTPRRTPKQEQKLRKDNEGVDPIAAIDPRLINNPDHVLFRCTKCHRAWHPDHLPPMTPESSDDPKERYKEYTEDWKCHDCAKYTTKIDVIVAWRLAKDETAKAPTSPVKKRTRSDEPSEILLIDNFSEDEKQYLIKWEHKSHRHVTWMPGAWVYNVVTASSKKAFMKRSYAFDLYKKTIHEAIPEEYLLIDIIFNVKYRSNAPPATTLDEDMDRVSEISKIYYKPQGLPYSSAVWDAPPDESNPDIYHSFLVAYQQFLAGKYFEHEPQARMKERIAEFKEKPFEDVILPSQPAGLKGKLMDYQINGVNWMLRRYHSGNNAILADEMGLGKTVQVITLLTTLVQDAPQVWPFLVVVPNSTCPNWRREIKQWSPELRVVTYYGGKESQNMAYDFELFPKGRPTDMNAHVVVMAYESAQDDETLSRFRKIHWAGIVIDEGQRLKNDKNLLYCALSSMRPTFRLLLTGTPLQNNKRELFNLLQFVDSKYNAESLDEQYRDLTSEKILELHQMISPYFYRRTKAGVLKFLPPMSQIIVPVSMTVVQEKLCKSIMAKNPQLIQAIFRNTRLKAKDRGSLSNILMQLRKCLCHPFLYSDAIEERNEDPQIAYRNLVEASGKLILLESLLTKLHEQGHRVLIFSQFLGQLDIIEDFLVGMGVKAARIDGSVSTLERQKSIDRFNEPGSELFAFLLSTRAGGVGINLATADTVIILDPDFNPHQDLQALSRAHRIGQRNKVLCLQLMTKDSVEEKIMQMGKKKMALDHALIERMGSNSDDGTDLDGILKHGAEALFKEGKEKERIHYDAAAIEKLLDRSFTKESQDAGPEAEFTYGKVWSNEGGGQVQDSLDSVGQERSEAVSSSVWESILAQREAEAAQELEAKKEILGRGGRSRRAVNYRTKGGDIMKDPDLQSDAEPEADLAKGTAGGMDSDFDGDSQNDQDEKEDIEDLHNSDEEEDLDFLKPGSKNRRKTRGLLATSEKGTPKPRKNTTASATPVSMSEAELLNADPNAPKPKRKRGPRKSKGATPASASPAPPSQPPPMVPPVLASNSPTPMVMHQLGQGAPPVTHLDGNADQMRLQHAPNHQLQPQPLQSQPHQPQSHLPRPPSLPIEPQPTGHMHQNMPKGMRPGNTGTLPMHPSWNNGMPQQQQQQQQQYPDHYMPVKPLQAQDGKHIAQPVQVSGSVSQQHYLQQHYHRLYQQQQQQHYQHQQQLQQQLQQQQQQRPQKRQRQQNTGFQNYEFMHTQAQAQRQAQATLHVPSPRPSTQIPHAPTPTPTIPKPIAAPSINNTRNSNGKNDNMHELRLLLPILFKGEKNSGSSSSSSPAPTTSEVPRSVQPTVAMIRMAIDSLSSLRLSEKKHRASMHFLDDLLQKAKAAQQEGRLVTIYHR